MAKRARGWRIAMWISLAVAIVMATGAVWSRTRECDWVLRDGWYVGLRGGAHCWDRTAYDMDEVWLSGPYHEPVVSFWRTERHVWMAQGANWSVDISLWVLAAAPLSLAAVSAWRIRRAGLGGERCSHCDYSRDGLNAATPCPECGKAPKV